MDFITKKAFESKVNKFSKDLGFNATSSSNSTPNWPTFGLSNNDVEQQQSAQQQPDELFPAPEAAYFDALPANYPPLFHLFYLDRTILSDAAQKPVSYAHIIYILLTLGAVMNTAVAIAVVVLRKGTDWPYLLASAIATVLLAVFELYTYQTAFRGAYKTSQKIRQRYVILGAVNLLIICVYAFAGVLFFNGWSRLRDVGEDHPQLRRALTIIEALFWTVMLFFNTFTMFEHYHFQRDGAQGLSSSAISFAKRAERADAAAAAAQEGEPPASGARINRRDRAAIEEIRDRYRLPV